MTPDGAYHAWRRACDVANARWREWGASAFNPEARRIARKRYDAAHAVQAHAAQAFHEIAAADRKI
jgi:hypothetical protein